MQTSAFQHHPVLLTEAIEQLNIRPNGVYVDGTFGRGGHSRAILSQLNEKGRLLAFDQDPAAIEAAKAFQVDPRFSIIHGSFSSMSRVLSPLGLSGKITGILLDIGMSSPQLDEPSRGFSFMRNGPLDMRMNTASGITAAEWLAVVDETVLANIIFEYGEERFSRHIAKAITEARKLTPIDTTEALAQLIEKAVSYREKGKHPATRTFQAIRIFINQELEELKEALSQSIDLLMSGGRLVVISFHSLEDRIVKQFMKKESSPPYIPKEIPVKHSDFQAKVRVVGKAIKPTALEIKENVRARSAVLRTLEKLS